MPMYAITATGSETAAGDMLEMKAPSDAALIIHQILISQSTEAGDPVRSNTWKLMTFVFPPSHEDILSPSLSGSAFRPSEDFRAVCASQVTAVRRREWDARPVRAGAQHGCTIGRCLHALDGPCGTRVRRTQQTGQQDGNGRRARQGRA